MPARQEAHSAVTPGIASHWQSLRTTHHDHRPAPLSFESKVLTCLTYTSRRGSQHIRQTTKQARNSCAVPTTLHHSTAIALNHSAPYGNHQPNNRVIPSIAARTHRPPATGAAAKAHPSLLAAAQQRHQHKHPLPGHAALLQLQHAPRGAPGQSALPQATQQRLALAPC